MHLQLTPEEVKKREARLEQNRRSARKARKLQKKMENKLEQVIQRDYIVW